MKHTADLDFALNRAKSQSRRQLVVAALALGFGVQLGLTAWRMQSLEAERIVLHARQRQLEGRSAKSSNIVLTAEQIKLAGSVQTMLNGLAVPWDSLLQAIEVARPARVVVDSITPHAADGLVSLSVSSPDFASVAAFVQSLMQQDALYGVMLASEATPDNGGALKAVVTAHWITAR
jgi:Tfp pilus assembly protein PilN